MLNRALTICLLIMGFSLGCLQTHSPSQSNSSIVLATTTSTYDSGLLDYLLPKFESETGIEVRVIPVGTGQALELGRRGDADIILVHSPLDEKRFVEDGFGIDRRCVMYNDFVLLGPEEDPAGVNGASAIKAFELIAQGNSIFISRGDNSGTHRKEIGLWDLAGVENKGHRYIETGTGMGQTLLTANEKKGYTLTDRSTYLSMINRLELSILVSDDRLLINPYSIININPEKNPGVRYGDAEKLSRWMISEDAQGLIGNFTKNSHQLFTPLYNICMED